MKRYLLTSVILIIVILACGFFMYNDYIYTKFFEDNKGSIENFYDINNEVNKQIK